MLRKEDCSICPEDNCPWCTFTEDCVEPDPAVVNLNEQVLQTCLKDTNYEVKVNLNKKKTSSTPLVEFDKKMKDLMLLGKPNKAHGVMSDSGQSERPTFLQRLASQSFRTARNVQQKIQLNNIYIDDYPLFEALGHITDAEETREFEGALRAAELATKNAKPEEVEAAAVKGARAYRAQVTEMVNLQMNHQVEVVGYVGITRN